MPETNQTELLQCNTCKEWKPCSAFNKRKDTKRGYLYKCKECEKKYYQDNAEYISQRDKKYREENAEYVKQQNRKYYQNNAEKINQRTKKYREENAEYYKQCQKQWAKDNAKYLKQYRKQYYKENAEYLKQYHNAPFKADDKLKRLEEIKKYEPYIVDGDNDVNFQCAYCGEYFKTTKEQVYGRLNAINGRGSDGAEHRLYCSQQCKYECPVYGQRIYTKNQVQGTSREVQPELRQMVLKRDNYTCQKCNKHKDDLEVGLHCHHIWPVNEDPIISADIDTCITYCKDCHKWVHMNTPGCGYGELKCSLEDEMLV